jgi:F0F1-type ATP synthase assembly protein I
VNEFGRASAYLALFSEIALILLVTTLIGVGIGYWIDQSLKTLPIFVVLGLLVGFGAGGLAVARLIGRFLRSFDRPATTDSRDGAGDSGAPTMERR